MGLLTGKYGPKDIICADDIRETPNPKTDYFVNAQANPSFLAQLDVVRDLLTTGGRSLVQGAIAWLWEKATQMYRSLAQEQWSRSRVSLRRLPKALYRIR